MCLHSVLNLSPVKRVKKCRFSNTNKNQNCTKIAPGKNTILLGFGYSTLMFMSKRAPRADSTTRCPAGLGWGGCVVHHGGRYAAATSDRQTGPEHWTHILHFGVGVWNRSWARRILTVLISISLTACSASYAMGTGEVLAHVGVISGCIVAIVLSPGSGFTVITFLIDRKGVCHRTYDGATLTKYIGRMITLMDRATNDQMGVRVQGALQDVYTNANIKVPAPQLWGYLPPCLQNLRAVLQSGPWKPLGDWTLPTLPSSNSGTKRTATPKPKGKKPYRSSDCDFKPSDCPNADVYEAVWNSIRRLQKGMPGFGITNPETWPEHPVAEIAGTQKKLLQLMKAVHADKCNATLTPECAACCEMVMNLLRHLTDYY